MKKIAKILGTSLLLAAFVWVGTVIADRRQLNEDLIRLHVVAASDSQEDQALKLMVRDRIVGSLQSILSRIPDAEGAKEYLSAHLDDLEDLANRALREAGSTDTATVTLTREAFPKRDYDTFSLPAGVYESLRITIGNGEGKNWWCVVFPSLCLPASAEGFEDTAAGAGFPDGLTGALEQQTPYQVRFFLLDCLGWLENFFHQF